MGIGSHFCPSRPRRQKRLRGRVIATRRDKVEEEQVSKQQESRSTLALQEALDWLEARGLIRKDGRQRQESDGSWQPVYVATELASELEAKELLSFEDEVEM